MQSVRDAVTLKDQGDQQFTGYSSSPTTRTVKYVKSCDRFVSRYPMESYTLRAIPQTLKSIVDTAVRVRP
jgi:hypothetical protein